MLVPVNLLKDVQWAEEAECHLNACERGDMMKLKEVDYANFTTIG